LHYNQIQTTIGKKVNNIYILSEKKVEGATNFPVFEINFKISDIDVSSYDALVFTSKNALYAIDSFNESWKTLPSYAIAPQTAKIVQDLGGQLEFTGVTNHGDKFALELVDLLKNKKVLYLRGAKVVSKLCETLNQNNILCDEIVVYESVCKKYQTKQSLPKGSIIIFSSPSTIECFLKNLSWDASFRAISIGKTTAQYFPSYIEPIVSDHTSLQSCVQKALELSSN
jgi:uroporphyrinogen-III synthase